MEMLRKIAAEDMTSMTTVLVRLVKVEHNRLWPPRPEKVSIVDERRTRLRRQKLWEGSGRVVIHKGGYYEIAPQVVDDEVVLDWMIQDVGIGAGSHTFTLGDLQDFMEANPVPPAEARWPRPPPGFPGVDYDVPSEDWDRMDVR